jgi:hypothetical protein
MSAPGTPPRCLPACPHTARSMIVCPPGSDTGRGHVDLVTGRSSTPYGHAVTRPRIDPNKINMHPGSPTPGTHSILLACVLGGTTGIPAGPVGRTKINIDPAPNDLAGRATLPTAGMIMAQTHANKIIGPAGTFTPGSQTIMLRAVLGAFAGLPGTATATRLKIIRTLVDHGPTMINIDSRSTSHVDLELINIGWVARIKPSRIKPLIFSPGIISRINPIWEV